jgi:hypothetical protein
MTARAAILILTALALTPQAPAESPAQITAGSFEQTQVPNLAFIVPGWQIETSTGRNTSAGVFGPARPALPKTLPDGAQCAFLFGDPAVPSVKISQPAGTVAAGRTYRLTAHIGRQNPGGDGRTDLPPYRLVLRDARDGSIKASAANPVTPAPGQFKPATLDYTPATTHPLVVAIEADSSPKATALLLDNLSLGLARTPAEEQRDRQQAALFQEKLAPIFKQRCTECHDAKKQKGGLRLDSLPALMIGGDSGPVLTPGAEAAKSDLLLRLASTDPEKRMPPKGDRLPATEIAALEQWIRDGALASDSPLLAAAAREAAQADPGFLGTAGANSEQQLIHRRAGRLALVEKPAPPPAVTGPVFNDLDRFIVAQWSRAKTTNPSPPEPALCDDSTFLRRAYLDVIGVSPTLAETRQFLADSAPKKRDRLVDELLARSADYAAHWTPFWLDALASNVAPTFGGVVSRGNHLPWIYESFAKNKPYDVFAAELLDPTMPGFKKPGSVEILGIHYKVSFLRSAGHKEVLQTAADVAQVFLGTGMKCASCHSHFDNDEWPQKRFLAFAGLFNERDLEQIRCEKQTGVFVPAASPFPQPGIPATAPADANGRLHLASLLLTDPTNPRFAKTIVNRLWKRYLGLGLFEPADDFRLDTPASHPALLDWLAYDFMAHGYDLQHTIRLILTSRTYQLRHVAALEDHVDILHPKDASRLYRSPSLRRLTAEQLLDSIALITTQKLDDKKRLYRTQEGVPDSLTNALGRPDIRSEVSTARSGEIAIVQALELLNGPQYNARINPDALLATLGPKPEPKAIVELLYLATLQRNPTEKELTLGTAFLTTATATEHLPLREATADMLWSILTSPAFQYVN